MTETDRYRPILAMVLVVLLAAAARPVHADLPTPERVTTSDSTALGAPPVVGADIPISELAHDQHLPAVAYNWRHDEYLVVWHNTHPDHARDIWAQRISSSGVLLGWSFEVHGDSAKDSAQPSVAYDGDHDRYLVTWACDESGDGSNWDVYARFIPWDGPSTMFYDFPVCTWSTSQWNPQVVYNENPGRDEFLVVWATETTGAVPAYVSGRRVNADASGFPSGAFPIASDPHYTDDYVNPDVAYNLARNEYLVAFSKNQVDVMATRLDADGNLLGGDILPVATWPDAELLPAVAASPDADQYFVAWQSYQNSTHYDIYGRFVNGDGTTADVLHITDWIGAAQEMHADIAYNPGSGRYLVVWEQQYDDLSGNFGIWGRLLHTDKTQDAKFEIVGPASSRDRWDPSVAAGSPGYLAIWEHERSDLTYQNVHGRIITPHALFLPIVLQGL